MRSEAVDAGTPTRRTRFAIGPPESGAWYRRMAGAVRAGEVTSDVETALLRSFAAAATQLTSTP